MSDPSERRIHPRYTAPYRVVVSAAEGARLASMTDNISGSGLFLAHNHDLPLDQPLDLTIHLPDGKRSVRCQGRVVRRIAAEKQGPAGYGVRLDFEDPGDAITYLRRVDALREGQVDVAPGAYPVLVVEDNEVLGDIVARSLPLLWKRRYAYGPFLDVDVAPSGDVALEMLNNRAYHLVISDIFMPKLDGRAFISQIRKDSAIAHIPILAISAGDVGEEVMHLDADAFLRKPLRLRDLFSTVHLLLAGSPVNARSVDVVHEDGGPSPLEQALKQALD